MNLKGDPLAMQRLKEAAEKAKIELSSSQSTDVNLPYITADASGPKHLNVNFSRAKLESLVEDWCSAPSSLAASALKDAGIDVGAINDVILVGGQTRMPLVQKLATEFFGKEARKDVNPDEAVAMVLLSRARYWPVTWDVAARRIAADPGYRNHGWRDDRADREEHHHPDQEVAGVLDCDDNQGAVTIHVLQGERKQASAVTSRWANLTWPRFRQRRVACRRSK